MNQINKINYNFKERKTISYQNLYNFRKLFTLALNQVAVENFSTINDVENFIHVPQSN